MWLKREGNRTEYIVRCASVTISPTENMLRKHNLTPGVSPRHTKTTQKYNIDSDSVDE